MSTDGLSWTSGTFADSPVTIYEGATYIYRITISPEEEDSIAGMTIFDPLEVYYPLEGETGYDTKGSWKGIIESVDTSQMSSWNIDPKVYYYIGGLTLGGMPLSDAEDCFNQIDLEDGNWVTEMPADRSTVTAVYVDATKDVNGNPYTLPKGQRISVDIHMRSPLGEAPFADSENRYDAAENAHAFNRTLVAGWLTKGQGDAGVYATNRTDFSKVGILPYSIEVDKEWDDQNDNDGVRPDSVTVELYGNGELVATTEITAANNWHGSFAHVRRYDDDSVPIQYTIKEIEIKDGETVLYTYEAERVSSGSSAQVFRLTNRHELITTNVPFSKQWDTSLAGDDEKARPDYIVVDLYRWVWDAEPDAETGERTG
ncbi:MAG: Cna B-type domain-containing protein, partial [Oscillospiraceae bacterium]|nr:Cna B-type domain-containing protein [Oscillospiraceae bacterium]